jgi:hypothetical protein
MSVYGSKYRFCIFILLGFKQELAEVQNNKITNFCIFILIGFKQELAEVTSHHIPVFSIDAFFPLLTNLVWNS